MYFFLKSGSIDPMQRLYTNLKQKYRVCFIEMRKGCSSNLKFKEENSASGKTMIAASQKLQLLMSLYSAERWQYKYYMKNGLRLFIIVINLVTCLVILPNFDLCLLLEGFFNQIFHINKHYMYLS